MKHCCCKHKCRSHESQVQFVFRKNLYKALETRSSYMPWGTDLEIRAKILSTPVTEIPKRAILLMNEQED